MVRAYVLIEAAVGKAKIAEEGIQDLRLDDATIVSVDVVTGQYDLIVGLEAVDLDKLGRVLSVIQEVNGLQRTTTCLVVKLGD